MAALDPKFVVNIEAKIDAIGDCADLSNYLQSYVFPAFEKMTADVILNVGVLAPLVTPPTDLSSAISWISSYISVSITGPHTKLLAEYTELVTAYASITAKIAAKSASISCGIPTIPLPVGSLAPIPALPTIPSFPSFPTPALPIPASLPAIPVQLPPSPPIPPPAAIPPLPL